MSDMTVSERLRLLQLRNEEVFQQRRLVAQAELDREVQRRREMSAYLQARAVLRDRTWRKPAPQVEGVPGAAESLDRLIVR